MNMNYLLLNDHSGQKGQILEVPVLAGPKLIDPTSFTAAPIHYPSERNRREHENV